MRFKAMSIWDDYDKQLDNRDILFDSSRPVEVLDVISGAIEAYASLNSFAEKYGLELYPLILNFKYNSNDLILGRYYVSLADVEACWPELTLRDSKEMTRQYRAMHGVVLARNVRTNETIICNTMAELVPRTNIPEGKIYKALDSVDSTEIVDGWIFRYLAEDGLNLKNDANLIASYISKRTALPLDMVKRYTDTKY